MAFYLNFALMQHICLDANPDNVILNDFLSHNFNF